jgi:hypothetical protein
MSEYKKNRMMTIVIVAIFIGIPLLVAIKSPALGGVLLLVGTVIAYRAMRLLMNIKNESSIQINKEDSAGSTIFVQIVDEFGRDLPPAESEKRLVEARAKAGPRDVVVPARFKVDSK